MPQSKLSAARVAKPERLDIAVLNIGVATEQFEISEDNENTLTVNVISITLLLFPILRSTAEKYNIEPVIIIVGSERKTLKSLATLNDRKQPT